MNKTIRNIPIDCEVYDYRDEMLSGNELKIVRSVYVNSCDISSLVDLGAEELNREKEISVQKESELFAKAKEAGDAWATQALETSMLEEALSYLKEAEKPIKHTSNVWKSDKLWDDAQAESISNAVYRMRIDLYKYGGYTHKKNYWHVSWYFDLNLNGRRASLAEIAGQDKKKFDTEESAKKYIAGRKKAYAKYFQEIYPPIPAEYANYFKVCGKLLPGYRVETEEDKNESSVCNE